jgi:hypothetical protein
MYLALLLYFRGYSNSNTGACSMWTHGVALASFTVSGTTEIKNISIIKKRSSNT